MRPREPPKKHDAPNASARASSDPPTPSWPEGIAERVLLYARGRPQRVGAGPRSYPVPPGLAREAEPLILRGVVYAAPALALP